MGSKMNEHVKSHHHFPLRKIQWREHLAKSANFFFAAKNSENFRHRLKKCTKTPHIANYSPITGRVLRMANMEHLLLWEKLGELSGITWNTWEKAFNLELITNISNTTQIIFESNKNHI